MLRTRSIHFEDCEGVKKIAAKNGMDKPIKKAPSGFENLCDGEFSIIAFSSDFVSM